MDKQQQRVVLKNWLARFEHFPQRTVELLFHGRAGKLEALFDETVEVLANPRFFPHPYINKLALNTKRLKQLEIVPFEVSEDVGTDTGFLIIGLIGEDVAKKLKENPESKEVVQEAASAAVVKNGCIYVSPSWAEEMVRDPIWQVAGVLFICAQANEFYHRRPLPPTAVEGDEWPFCDAVQAEYFKLLKDIGVVTDLSDFPNTGLDKYPDGLASLPEGGAYEIQPVVKHDFDILEIFSADCPDPAAIADLLAKVFGSKVEEDVEEHATAP